MLYTKFRACTHVSTWFVIFPGKWTFRGNFEAKIFSSHKNLSHIITRHIFHLICLSFQYPTDPPSISHEGKDRGRARQVCVQKVSFSIYVIPWDLIYICVCHKVRPSPRAIVTNVSRSVTCQIGKHSYRESTGKVSFFVDATFRYLTKLARYQRQKIPPIPSVASKNCDSVYLRYIHDKLLRNSKKYLYINEIRKYFDEN